jgi:hypothetical protein
MPEVFIPQIEHVLELTEDWQVELSWDSKNLVMLKHFNLTGMKTFEVGDRLKYDDRGVAQRDEDGKFIREKIYRRETVVNPLFKDYEGRTTPALVTFPKGTRFRISKYNTGYNGYISSVYMKCLESSKAGITGKNILLGRETFNGVQGTWTDK